MGVRQHMMVTAARITLRWRPGSKRIPSIDGLVFVHQQEIANQEEAEILQYVQSFKLARVHIWVHVDKEGHIGRSQVLWQVLERAPSPEEYKRYQLEHYHIKEIGIIEWACEKGVEAEERPHATARQEHQIVGQENQEIANIKKSFAASLAVQVCSMRANVSHRLIDKPPMIKTNPIPRKSILKRYHRKYH